MEYEINFLVRKIFGYSRTIYWIFEKSSSIKLALKDLSSHRDIGVRK